MGERTPKERPSGSHLSDKQIAHSAVRGRKVTFSFFNTNPVHEVVGYIVGTDAYHWFVATPVTAPDRSEKVALSLVHKGRVDVIGLGSHPSLADEPEEIRDEVTRIGASFWSACSKTYSIRP